MLLDELTNEELEATVVTDEQRAAELERVREVQKSHALTGVDLTYWYEREEILERMVSC